MLVWMNVAGAQRKVDSYQQEHQIRSRPHILYRILIGGISRAKEVYSETKSCIAHAAVEKRPWNRSRMITSRHQDAGRTDQEV